MSDDLEEALEAQQLLLETSLPLVFQAFDDALERKVEEPVVVLGLGGQFIPLQGVEEATLKIGQMAF